MFCADKKLYLLGHPISHSKSPAMYNAVYGHIGLPWRYDFMDLENECDARKFLEARDFLSINITTPYKPLAYGFASARDASAVLARGANLLVKTGDEFVAYNTDGLGCVAYLEREGVALRGARAVVCGTGPTSLSILHALATAGVGEVTLLSRNAAKAEAVLEGYLSDLSSLGVPFGGVIFHADEYGASSNGATASAAHGVISVADIVVDATPLGMSEGDPAPFDTSCLHEGQTAFDVVYGHGETAFAAGARAAGARVLTGEGMLVGQAVVTVRVVLDAAGAECSLSADDLFDLMAKAAGFVL